MYIDPMIGIIRYEEDVRRAEERIRHLQALEERARDGHAEARHARRAGRARGLRGLLPHHP